MAILYYFSFILFLLLAGTTVFYIKERKKRINNEILFTICDHRRELMVLARENKIDVNSISFNFMYRFMSNLIRYTRDYKFFSDTFLEHVERDEKAISENKLQDRLESDAKSQGEEVFKLLDGFIKSLVDSMLKCDGMFVFKYQIAIEKKRKKKLQNPKAQALYNDFTSWQGRLA